MIADYISHDNRNFLMTHTTRLTSVSASSASELPLVVFWRDLNCFPTGWAATESAWG